MKKELPANAPARPGYYPTLDVMSQQSHWDSTTRVLVDKRLRDHGPTRTFFTASEWAVMEAVIEHLMPQSDRPLRNRIPILPFIDERLAKGKTAGFQFAGMPPDGEAYRLGLKAIGAMSESNFALPFLELESGQQEQLLASIQKERPLSGADAIWLHMAAKKFWALVFGDVLDVYYAHPNAWNEIGFSGPAYPRGYMRLENGDPEPFEVVEDRTGAPPAR